MILKGEGFEIRPLTAILINQRISDDTKKLAMAKTSSNGN